MRRVDYSADKFNTMGKEYLPGLLGLKVIEVADSRIVTTLNICKHHLAPNDYLHAGSVVTLADTSAGYGCLAHLPEGASGFTTVELKSNHLGTARDGGIECVATAVHLGKTTQVWDAIVTNSGNRKTIALFRCTQMILYSK